MLAIQLRFEKEYLVKFMIERIYITFSNIRYSEIDKLYLLRKILHYNNYLNGTDIRVFSTIIALFVYEN